MAPIISTARADADERDEIVKGQLLLKTCTLFSSRAVQPARAYANLYVFTSPS